MIYKPHYEAIIQTQAHRILKNAVSEILEKESKLNMPEWTLLGLLADSPNIRPIEIASILDVDPPFITVIIEKLTKERLISVRPNKEDKRSKLLVLTVRGRELVKNLERIVYEQSKHLLVGVNSSDMKSYFKVLEAIIQNSQSELSDST
jgi:DNA-binding MarR family transcriptional regulator